MPSDSQQLLKYCIKNVRSFPNIFLNVGTYYLKLFCQETVIQILDSTVKNFLIVVIQNSSNSNKKHGILKLLFISKNEKCFKCFF